LTGLGLSTPIGLPSFDLTTTASSVSSISKSTGSTTPPPPRPPRRDSETPPTSPQVGASPSGHNGHGGIIRTTSLRRKPVPDYLPMPVQVNYPIPFPNSSLPSTHPFASKSHEMMRSGSDSPITPGTMRLEDELFFSPPTRNISRNGPPPPRRTFSPAGSIKASTISRIGTPLAVQAPSIRSSPEPNPIELGTSVVQAEVVPQTKGQDVNVTLDNAPRPPAKGASSLPRRSDSLESVHTNPMPLTPNTPFAIASRTIDFVDPISPANDPTSKATMSAKKTRPTSGSGSKPPVFGARASAIRNSSLPQNQRQPFPPPQSSSDESASDDEFSVDKVPSRRRIIEAGTLFLRDEDGHLVPFSELFPATSASNTNEGTSTSGPSKAPPKTILFFIRHFWCGQCQDYTFASLSLLDLVALAEANIRVVVISNGSWKIIKSYKKLFKCPFPIYVDGPRKLYQLLGFVLSFCLPVLAELMWSA
jgi:hypothetical protein